jgi:hypothetical protein
MPTRIACTFIIALAVLLPAHLHAQHALVKAKVEECNAALFQGDYEKLIDLTYPGLVEWMGGRQAMLETMENSMKEIKGAGFSFDSSRVEEPTRIVKTKRRTYAVVPYQFVMKAPIGRFLQRSTMLGVSEDKGKSWTFVDVHNDPETLLLMVFPDEKGLNKRLKLKPRPGLIELPAE